MTCPWIFLQGLLRVGEGGEAVDEELAGAGDSVAQGGCFGLKGVGEIGDLEDWSCDGFGMRRVNYGGGVGGAQVGEEKSGHKERAEPGDGQMDREDGSLGRVVDVGEEARFKSGAWIGCGEGSPEEEFVWFHGRILVSWWTLFREGYARGEGKVT